MFTHSELLYMPTYLLLRRTNDYRIFLIRNKCTLCRRVEFGNEICIKDIKTTHQ